MEKYIDIIRDIITLLVACGWFTSGRKHKKEIESIAADIKQKEMNLAQQYVDEFKKNIVKPLQREVIKLRNAVNGVNTCPHNNDCPVKHELQKQAAADNISEK
ncbi:MAG: hypothetical protein II817_07310 [Bacteroidales bacterium]|nr:hypothetical protein [Bacteroidales bacterium]MBQ6082992.1 hypothetical protein [Bacteroidales bacterium]